MPQCNFNIREDQDESLSSLAKDIGLDRSALVRIALDEVIPFMVEIAEKHNAEKLTAGQLRETRKRSISKSSVKRRS